MQPQQLNIALHNGTIGLRVPQTLERFELWGACGDLNLPSLPTPNLTAYRDELEGKGTQ